MRHLPRVEGGLLRGLERRGVASEEHRPPDEAERVVGEAVRALESLDALIHAVGKGFPGAFMETDESGWQRAFELDFFSAVRMVRLAVAHMKEGSRITLLGAASAKQPRS